MRINGDASYGGQNGNVGFVQNGGVHIAEHAAQRIQTAVPHHDEIASRVFCEFTAGKQIMLCVFDIPCLLQNKLLPTEPYNGLY